MLQIHIFAHFFFDFLAFAFLLAALSSLYRSFFIFALRLLLGSSKVVGNVTRKL